MSNADFYHYQSLKKSGGTAVALELLCGGFFAICGLGNFYAGNTVAGVLLLVSYWILQGINVLLMFILVGFFTAPLTWLVYMVLGPILASGAVDRHNRELAMRLGVRA